MKKNFVKTTLTLSLLLMAAAPAQAFAGTNTECELSVPLNQQVVVKDLNNLLSNNSLLNSLNTKNCLNLELLSKLPTTLQSKDYQKISLKQLKDLKTKSGKVAATPSKTPTKADNNSQKEEQTTKPTNTIGSNTNTTTNSNTNTTTNTNTNAATNNTNTNTGASDTAGIGSYEQQVANIVNQERAAAGLAPLTLNAGLSKVAEAKAQDMLDNNYFSHTSPTYGSPFDMMKQFGISYTTAGENIAMGQQTPQSVMDAWMNSSGHRANILNSSYGKIGVGYVKGSNGTTYWVQEFTN